MRIADVRRLHSRAMHREQRRVSAGWQLAQQAGRIYVHTPRELVDGTRPADVVPRVGLDGRSDQLDQRIEIGEGPAAASAALPAAERPVSRKAAQRRLAGQIAGDVGRRVERRTSPASSCLGRCNVAQQPVALPPGRSLRPPPPAPARTLRRQSAPRLRLSDQRQASATEGSKGRLQTAASSPLARIACEPFAYLLSTKQHP